MTVLGVAGHVDHGKTALVGALTGMQTDRLAEEQARGISLTLGFAHLRIGEAVVDLIDMPGHERFVRTMIAGAAGIDAMLLVVDAREGVMPQTREHADICTLLGIDVVIPVISRADLAVSGEIDEAAASVTRLIARAGLRASPPIPVSARDGTGLDELRAAIAEVVRTVRPVVDDGAPFLAADRAFSVPGHGTVITGTLRGGVLATGDAVEIVPAGIATRIRGLHIRGQPVAVAQPGQRVAVNLRQVEPALAGRGTALAAPGALAASAWLSVMVRSVADAPALETTQTLRLLLGTAELDARLRLLDREVLRPGETAPAQLRCAVPVAAPARSRFVLRLPQAGTVAGGMVLDCCAVRVRRHQAGEVARLVALAGAEPAGVVAGELARAGVAGVPLARLARLAGLSAARAAALLPEDAVTLRDGGVIGGTALDALAAVLPRVIAPHEAGVARETLARLLPKVGRSALDEALARLLASGVLAREGALYRLQRSKADGAVEAAAARLAETLRCTGLSPPDPGELAPDLARRRALARLVRAGVVVRAPDLVQKREIMFHRDAIAEARGRLAELLTEDGLAVGEIGAALGISRKFSVPLLEYLDSVRFTERRADRRVLAAGR